MADPRGGRGLAAALEEAGPKATASEAALAAVMGPFSPPSEAAVAAVLGMVARTSEGKLSGDMAGISGSLAAAPLGDGASTWNVAVLAGGLAAASPHLDWPRVAGALDQPGFLVPDAGALKLLMAAWARGSGGEPFPLTALVGSLWANTAGQLSFLRQAAAAPPELFSWAHAARRLEPVEGLHAGKSAHGTPNQAWCCLDLADCLARLADSGHGPAVRQILELPLKQCPEVLLLCMATVKSGWGPLQQVGWATAGGGGRQWVLRHRRPGGQPAANLSHAHACRPWPLPPPLALPSLTCCHPIPTSSSPQEVVDPLVVTYVASHPNSSVVLARLWPLNRDVLLRALVSLWQKDASNVARVLDVCQVRALLLHIHVVIDIRGEGRAGCGNDGSVVLHYPGVPAAAHAAAVLALRCMTAAGDRFVQAAAAGSPTRIVRHPCTSRSSRG